MPTLNWIGKEAVVNHHQQVPVHLFKDMPPLGCGEPGDRRNVIYCAACLLGKDRLQAKRIPIREIPYEIKVS